MHRLPGVMAVLGAAATFALTPSLATAAAPAPTRTADSFVDSVGINTHTYYTDTVYYSEYETVKQRLAELGVRNIRENLMTDRPDQYERLNELAGMGIRPTLILGDPSEGTSYLDELISTLKTDLAGSVAAVEGPNEIDMHGDASLLPQLPGYQQHLYSAIKSDPALASLPVVGPSLVHSRNQEALGDISSRLDYGNIHSYPDGYEPESNLDRHFRNAANNSGSKPLMATETGYHTALGWDGEHKPVSEQAMATYIPRMYLEYFRRGVVKTFSYELLDEAAGSTNREDSFGLLNHDLSPKPAFTALHNTIEILSDPGAAFTPEALDYSVEDKQDDLRHVLLQKRDGSFYLALWRASAVWDPVSQSPIDESSRPATVDFGRQVLAAEQYQPNSSSAPVGSLRGSNGRLTIAVGPRVTILKVSLGKSVQGRIKLWLSRSAVPEGGRVTVKGLLPPQVRGSAVRVKIQSFQRGAWRTVGSSRTSRKGGFRKAIRLKAGSYGRSSRLRVVAPRKTKPSRAVRVRIRRLG